MVTTYRNWQTGDAINICVSIDQFCGMYSKIIHPKDINVTRSSETCSLEFGYERGCGLHLNNVKFTFKLVKVSGSVEGKTCAPQQVYKTIGSARTNSDGVAGIIYIVTERDRLDYENATSVGYPYKVMACITDADGNPIDSYNTSIVTDNITVTQNLCYGVSCNDICVGNDLYWQNCDPLTGNCVRGELKEPNSIKCLPATHSVDFQLGLVPTELAQYFAQYVVYIGDNLVPWMATNVPGFAFPANWIYLRTEYDSITNTFRMMMRYTGTLSSIGYIDNLGITEDLAALWNTINTYKFAILAGIIALLALVLVVTVGLSWYVVLWLIGAVTILVLDIIYLSTQVKEYEQRTKNAETIVGQRDKEDGQIVNIDEEWNNSPKQNSDCIKRLESIRDLHKRIIEGYAEQFNEVAAIVNAMNDEKTKFMSDAQAIIDQFNADPTYSAAICDSYYASLRNKLDESNVRINDIISADAPGGSGGEYEPPVLCADHITKEECEAAGCIWDNGVCKAKECLIPSPLGGCLLYKEAAKGILIFGAALILGVLALGIVSRGPPRR